MAGQGRDIQAYRRIGDFLKKYPDGRLHVITGYTSMFGLRWLAERSAGRPVTVVVGDLRQGMRRFTDDDAYKAAEFVGRSDVQILNWYRTNKSRFGAGFAHCKVFAVEGSDGGPVAVLVGSANLTRDGLYQNVESMVQAIDGDDYTVFDQIIWLENKGWDASERIMKRVKARLPAAGYKQAAEQPADRGDHRRDSDPVTDVTKQPATGSGTYREDTLSKADRRLVESIKAQLFGDLPFDADNTGAPDTRPRPRQTSQHSTPRRRAASRRMSRRVDNAWVVLWWGLFVGWITSVMVLVVLASRGLGS